MRALIIPILLAIATAASAQPVAKAGDIIVTGQRERAIEGQLAACLARGCSVADDARLSLALADVRFGSGDYKSARSAVAASLDRTRGQASGNASPVADLWRGRSRIAGHLGEYAEFESGAIQALRTLRSSFGAGDPRVIAAALDVVDAQVHLGKLTIAERGYRDVIDRADAAGAIELASTARLRLATLVSRAVRGRSPATAERNAAAVLAPLLTASGPRASGYAFAARLLVARLAERRGATGAVAAAFASIPPETKLPRVLMTSQPIALRQESAAVCEPTQVRGCDNPRDLTVVPKFDKQWIDVAFTIRPDGQVEDVEVLRRGAQYEGDWADRVMTSIRSRRYSQASGDAAGAYRVERFTLTSGYRTLTGTTMRVRRGNEVIERVDLTAAEPDASAS